MNGTSDSSKSEHSGYALKKTSKKKKNNNKCMIKLLYGRSSYNISISNKILCFINQKLIKTLKCMWRILLLFTFTKSFAGNFILHYFLINIFVFIYE